MFDLLPRLLLGHRNQLRHLFLVQRAVDDLQARTGADQPGRLVFVGLGQLPDVLLHACHNLLKFDAVPQQPSSAGQPELSLWESPLDHDVNFLRFLQYFLH